MQNAGGPYKVENDMSSIVENFMSKVIIKEWQRLNLCSCLRHYFSCSIFVAKWVPGSKSLVHLVLMVVRDEHSDKETGTSHLRWQKSIGKFGRISPIKPGTFKTGGSAPKLFPFFLNSWKKWLAQKKRLTIIRFSQKSFIWDHTFYLSQTPQTVSV